MDTKEILTFQFGNYSNYVGSHWWNLQEFSFNYDSQSEPSQIDHGVFYREGLNEKGYITFTPRLLLVDQNGTLNGIPESGGLYSNSLTNPNHELVNEEVNKKLFNDIKKEISWDSTKIDIVQTEPSNQVESKSDINLDEETLDAWSDFLYTRFHPRTINILKKHKFSAEKESIDTFTYGTTLWNSNIFQETFIDNIRRYMEECNNCQGFQTLFDLSNGFSGLACKNLEYLQDEYGKTNLAVPLFSPKSILYENADEKLSYAIRLVNIAATYSSLTEHSSLFIPLSTQDYIWKKPPRARTFRYMDYNSKSLYHTSAILATYLETISLRYRLRSSGYSSHLFEFCCDLNNYGRKLAAAALSLPFPLRQDEDLIDMLNEIDYPISTQLSPNCKIGTDYIIQSVSVRGIPKSRLKRPLQEAQKQMKMAAYRCSSVSEMLQLYFQCSNHASMAHVAAVETPIHIKNLYPEKIFHPNLNIQGFLTGHQRQTRIKSIPCMASIQNSTDLSKTIESLHNEARRVNISKIHRFKETGMEADDYVEILENLMQFKDAYEDTIDL
ncbi:protein misato isoform X2 [Condylostylus longicornis]|uniref:protein misato isoform X2 n=1 Tax=Condylostylus longicornis TaxID=2530218 RepID=UPI00244E510D|nr:protein misato isoform X2 [Condylostylus longicornis]